MSLTGSSSSAVTPLVHARSVARPLHVIGAILLKAIGAAAVALITVVWVAFLVRVGVWLFLLS